MHCTGCEVCGNDASITLGDMCLCAPCAGAPESHVTSGVVDLLQKTSPLYPLGLDPISLVRTIRQTGNPIAAADRAADTIQDSMKDITSMVKWMVVAGSVTVLAFVGYEVFKKKPARAA